MVLSFSRWSISTTPRESQKSVVMTFLLHIFTCSHRLFGLLLHLWCVMVAPIEQKTFPYCFLGVSSFDHLVWIYDHVQRPTFFTAENEEEFFKVGSNSFYIPVGYKLFKTEYFTIFRTLFFPFFRECQNLFASLDCHKQATKRKFAARHLKNHT